MRRLLLVRHAATSATRTFAFPVDEPLDERGRAAAATLGTAVSARHETLCSPALRCRQTAQAGGLAEPRMVPELAECDFGSWAGRTLAEICETDPDGARAWMTEPASAPHGGESLAAFADRVGVWLEGQMALEGRAIAITHGGVVKAAVVHALRAPIQALWRIDVTPLAVTELHGRDGRWTLTRVNCAL